MKQNHVLSWSLLLFLPLLLEAQSITIQESSKSMDDYLHKPFQLVAGQYISINYAEPHGAFTANRNNIALVTCYDTKMSQLYSTEISALAGKKYQGGMAFDNRLYIFFYNDKNVSVGELDAARSTRLVAVTITPDSSKASRVIEEKEDEDFHIAPHQPYNAYNGEMFCTSYAYKSTGRWSYNPVLIKLR